ncbi:MAG: hypothetical protein IPO51_09025 [Dehalococcoidia bacterium]|nr:hypothetical protein [Dehalococcoidia bacterium]
MTALRPYTVARYGIYAAAGVALISVWLGVRAGTAFDFALLRSVFYFVIVAALGFGAEAVLLFTPLPAPPPPAPEETEPSESLEFE